MNWKIYERLNQCAREFLGCAMRVKGQFILSPRFPTRRVYDKKKNHAVVHCILVIFIFLSTLRDGSCS